MSAASLLLWAAAAYNTVIALPGLFARGAPVQGRVTSLLVCAFGLAYAIAATDPLRFAPMLWAGVLGKLGVIALMAPAVRSGEAPRALGWVLAGDALFTAGFVWLILSGL